MRKELIYISENTRELPRKKTVRWAENLVEIREYEKPYKKGSYGELSKRIGKAVRVRVKNIEEPDSNCICG